MKIINPSNARIFESWDPYVDFFNTDHRGWIVPDLDRIRSLAQYYDFVLANCSTEHWGSVRDFPLVARLHDLLAEYYKKDFVCLCHDPADQSLRPNILYFPFYAWWKRWRSVNPMQVANPDRTFLISNLNHVARDFRIVNYLRLKHKTYADKCYLTMHNIVQENHQYDYDFKLAPAENLGWQQIRSSLPCKKSDGFGWIFDMAQPALADAYLHLVSESTIKDKIFLTEKTWQAIFAGQLFVIWGNRGIITHLRDLGVDVFDDVVNHAYDEITDHRTRFECLHNELDRLALLDWRNIYLVTATRRLTNTDRFCSGAFISRCVSRLNLRLPAKI